MKNSFVQQFSQNIKFKYSCFDRVILRGYIRWLFFPGGVVKFLRAMGFRKLSNGVMRILTDQLNAHILKVAQAKEVPIHWLPSVDGGKGGAKQKFVQEKYARHDAETGDHLYCILTDKEPVRTFACRELTSKNGKKYEKIYDCRKPVKQYYIYFHDQLLGGPCYLKISSYLPFQCEFYFNGHNAIQAQLDKQGIHYRRHDNAFVDVDDPEAIRNAVKSLSGRAVLNRVNHWMNLFFKFDKGKYSTCSKYLQHEWYLSQVEISSNIVFRSARFCTSLFERILDKFQRLGLPESITQIFSRRPHRGSISKTFWRLYNNACIKHWFRGNSIKQYNKTGFFIRTETTINNPKSLGLQKPVLYLQACLWKGVECNNRFLDCCADVDVSSLSDQEPDIFTKPVTDPAGRSVSAPDFRKDRQTAMAKELLKPKYRVYGFKTAHLFKNLSGHFRNPAQIRYEMNKLKARDVLKKHDNQSFYVVTQKGFSWLWLEICSGNFFKNPMISRTMKNDALQLAAQPSQIEEAYDSIQRGLSKLTQQLAIIPC
ncbi:MAG: hypothetical protein Q7J31_15410, partial [Syntrophales bacterium]|nr:hypothetical protein [Syntrophales bacterium]